MLIPMRRFLLDEPGGTSYLPPNSNWTYDLSADNDLGYFRYPNNTTNDIYELGTWVNGLRPTDIHLEIELQNSTGNYEVYIEDAIGTKIATTGTLSSVQGRFWVTIAATFGSNDVRSVHFLQTTGVNSFIYKIKFD